eukprot:SAG11_NODE_103_length_16571_cov_49.569208_21_plen_119_part_01
MLGRVAAPCRSDDAAKVYRAWNHETNSGLLGSFDDLRARRYFRPKNVQLELRAFNPRCGGGPVKSPGCSTPTFFPRLMMIWERIEICAEVSCRSRVYVGGLGRQLLRAFNASKRSSKCK